MLPFDAPTGHFSTFQTTLEGMENFVIVDAFIRSLLQQEVDRTADRPSFCKDDAGGAVSQMLGVSSPEKCNRWKKMGEAMAERAKTKKDATKPADDELTKELRKSQDDFHDAWCTGSDTGAFFASILWPPPSSRA